MLLLLLMQNQKHHTTESSVNVVIEINKLKFVCDFLKNDDILHC